MTYSFNTPDSLSYSKPSEVVDGDINFVEFQPVAGSSFVQDQALKIKLTSTSEFLDVRRSYLKFDLKLTGGATTAGNMISTLGGASVIRRINTSLAGQSVEEIDNYNLYCSVNYKRLPETNKNFIKETEFYTNQTVLTSSSSAYTNGRTVYHPLRTALFESDQMIPLAFVRSGIELDIQLAPLNDLICGDSDSTGYEVSNVRFVACLLKPTEAYLRSFQSTLEKGSTAFIPMQITKNVRLTPGTTSEQSHSLNIGFYKSLRSVLAVCRESTSINTATTDSFNLETNNGLKQYYFRVGSERYPKNFDVSITNGITSGTVRCEQLMIAICSLDNTYSQFNAVSHTADTAQFVYWNFATNPSIGAGIAIEDGSITYNHTYWTAPAGTETIDFFFTIDAQVKISAYDIAVDFREF